MSRTNSVASRVSALSGIAIPAIVAGDVCSESVMSRVSTRPGRSTRTCDPRIWLRLTELVGLDQRRREVDSGAIHAHAGPVVGWSAGRAESLAVGRGCRRELTPERAPHRLLGAEADRAGDGGEGFIAALQARLGRFDAHALDVAARSDP